MEDFPDGIPLGDAAHPGGTPFEVPAARPADGEFTGSLQDGSHDHPQDEEGRFCGSCEDARHVLGLLEVYGTWNPAWRAEWDRCLQAAADGASGVIAGHRMRTQDKEGCAVTSECVVPVPGPGSGFAPEEVFSAFGYAMVTEIRSRLAVMKSPGGEG